MTNQWISIEDEAPPEDGFYYVTNNPDNAFDAQYFYYDGYGFSMDGEYRDVKYWRKNTLKRQKVYGVKQKESLQTPDETLP